MTLFIANDYSEFKSRKLSFLHRSSLKNRLHAISACIQAQMAPTGAQIAPEVVATPPCVQMTHGQAQMAHEAALEA